MDDPRRRQKLGPNHRSEGTMMIDPYSIRGFRAETTAFSAATAPLILPKPQPPTGLTPGRGSCGCVGCPTNEMTRTTARVYGHRSFCGWDDHGQPAQELSGPVPPQEWRGPVPSTAGQPLSNCHCCPDSCFFCPGTQMEKSPPTAGPKKVLRVKLRGRREEQQHQSGNPNNRNNQNNNCNTSTNTNRNTSFNNTNGNTSFDNNYGNTSFDNNYGNTSNNDDNNNLFRENFCNTSNNNNKFQFRLHSFNTHDCANNNDCNNNQGTTSLGRRWLIALIQKLLLIAWDFWEYRKGIHVAIGLSS